MWKSGKVEKGKWKMDSSQTGKDEMTQNSMRRRRNEEEEEGDDDIDMEAMNTR